MNRDGDYVNSCVERILDPPGGFRQGRKKPRGRPGNSTKRTAFLYNVYTIQVKGKDNYEDVIITSGRGCGFAYCRQKTAAVQFASAAVFISVRAGENLAVLVFFGEKFHGFQLVFAAWELLSQLIENLFRFFLLISFQVGFAQIKQNFILVIVVGVFL
ncbi:hypothetical protein SAMN02745165_03188 [Malonomonas rubra DSM 5091]|uniref:Uncharacterized protein n=1 Tax=Malonomonas rubra DSM 5091 TaxID=1122189 RepID=A0A1M6M6N9_MALRU|nr:hypothetical protein SAMN02745165_03188 [Malonomonas rubra DSM 5091]